MYGYIYKTTCLVNNTIYVGQKKSTKFLGQKYLGSGKILKLAIKKYGKENFLVELLEECDTFDKLNESEKFWIKELDARNSKIGYNISEGGQGTCGVDPGYHDGMLGKHQSEHQKEVARNNGPAISVGLLKVSDKLSRSAKARTKNRVTNNNQIGINKDGISKMVKANELDSYISDGWALGIPKSEEAKSNLKDNYAKGSYINKDGVVKFIANDKLDNFINDGWSLGKKPKDQYKSSHHKYF